MNNINENEVRALADNIDDAKRSCSDSRQLADYLYAIGYRLAQDGVVYKTEVNIEPLNIDRNKELIEALKAERDELELLLFAVVRNSAVLPIGIMLKKSDEEVADKVFETIAEIRKMIDRDRMREFMNKAACKGGGK